ncbi:MAG: DUF4105 domain-containing protein [Chitinophagaceae bacterium]|nr:DUF4105 domain-containing protein [Chitinophagaceae bacterium]MCW5928760.1 DUF4105 domain-containing protein [Chitinophagaceae bacterium]
MTFLPKLPEKLLVRAFILLPVALVFFLKSFSQDSSHLRISLLTCSPGEELYSSFGHSALRVTDTTTHTDIVYNYGTFDFYDPDFYVNFVKGKLNYYLNTESFREFVYAYEYEQRSVVEQELSLTGDEKIKLYAALRNNAREENKYYRYDFLFDNCATRIRDIVKTNVSDSLQIPEILPKEQITFRNLIHEYLDNNKAWWSKVGIDILLGAGLDAYSTSEQSMFLPDYLYKGFDGARDGQTALVEKRLTIFTPPQSTGNTDSYFTPFIAFSVLLLVFILFSFSPRRLSLTILDFILFLSTGLLGILLVFMWTGTDHQLCRNNYNLLWAIPLHTIAAFTLFSKKLLIPVYWKLSAVIGMLLLVLWIVLPQNLNESLLPLIVLLGWRSWALGKRK